VAVAAVDARRLGLGVLQPRVDPATEGFAGRAGNDGGRVVGGQGVVRSLKVLLRQSAEILRDGGASGERQR